MVTQRRCASCGRPVDAGAAFCGVCGAKQVQPQAQTCRQCGAALPPDAAFCGTCGTPLREGARFCRVCGAAAGAPPAAQPAGPRPADHPRPASAPILTSQLTWNNAAAGVGFLLAFISVFLAWASVQGFSVDPLDDGVRFRIGDIIDTDSIDGYVVILGALAGFAALGASLVGRVAIATGRQTVAGIGGVLAVLAFIEMQYVVSQQGLGVSNIGFGLYVLLIGGLLAAASPWIPERPLTGQ